MRPMAQTTGRWLMGAIAFVAMPVLMQERLLAGQAPVAGAVTPQQTSGVAATQRSC